MYIYFSFNQYVVMHGISTLWYRYLKEEIVLSSVFNFHFTLEPSVQDPDKTLTTGAVYGGGQWFLIFCIELAALLLIDSNCLPNRVCLRRRC